MIQADVAKLLRVCRTVWPDIPAGEDTIKAWTWALGDLPYPIAQHAIQVWMRTSPFAPKPADLRKIVAEEAVGSLSWEAAWDELVRTATRYGSYLNVPGYHRSLEPFAGWSSPEVEAAVRHVGYRNYCECETAKIGMLRAQFRDFFTGHRERLVRGFQTGAVPLPVVSAGDSADAGVVALNRGVG